MDAAIEGLEEVRVLRHGYAVEYDFAGGKGAATMAGVLFAFAPNLLLVVVSVWLAVLVLTGYVGLATIVAGVSLPLAMAARTMSPVEIAGTPRRSANSSA